MKISHDKVSWILKEYYYPDIVNRKCIHIISLLCWLIMIVLGALIIGVGTNNVYNTYQFCSDSETFCTKQLIVQTEQILHVYVKLTGYHQNNRNFMDYYSVKQLHGQIDNKNRCGQHYTYSSISKSQTVGGYRVNPTSAHIHPCGQVMEEVAVDIVYLVDNLGGTPQLDNGDLISQFNLNHFKRLENYQLSQWIDVKSAQFINYFSVSITGIKYQLIGKAKISAGNYQIVIQNNYPTKGQFKKQLIISQVGLLGLTNHILGFVLFCYGIFLLFFHVYICFRWKK